MAEVGSQFYVYRFDNDEGQCIYIGKGSGRRLQAQNKRFGREGYIVKWFALAGAAYRYEAFLIEKLKPIENKVAGGAGPGSKRTMRRPRKSKELLEIERIGTRAYAAKFLLTRDLRGIWPAEKIARHRSQWQSYLDSLAA